MPTYEAPRTLSRGASIRIERTTMTSETEMNLFFVRNCYTPAQRQRVKAWRPYQIAMEKNDVVHAQEIAMRLLEHGLDISSGGSEK